MMHAQLPHRGSTDPLIGRHDLDAFASVTPWEETSESRREDYREIVQHLVDALGDLLPTAQESRYIGRGMLRRTRFVGGWKEPDESA